MTTQTVSQDLLLTHILPNSPCRHDGLVPSLLHTPLPRAALPRRRSSGRRPPPCTTTLLHSPPPPPEPHPRHTPAARTRLIRATKPCVIPRRCHLSTSSTAVPAPRVGRHRCRIAADRARLTARRAGAARHTPSLPVPATALPENRHQRLPGRLKTPPTPGAARSTALADLPRPSPLPRRRRQTAVDPHKVR
jgi:hypothetical protein